MDNTALMMVFGLAGILSIVLFILYGFDKKINPIKSTTPPDDITPLDARIIHGGHISTADLAPLLIFWANKGYVSINGIGKMGEDEYQIVKLKDSDNNMKPYEKQLFDGLFKESSAVSIADIKGNFLTAEKIPSSAFLKKSGKASALICGLMAGLCTGLMVGTVCSHGTDIVLGVTWGTIIFIITVFFCVLLKLLAVKAVDGSKNGVVLFSVIYVALLIYMAYSVYTSSDFSTAAIISVLSAALCGFASAFCKKHTKQGNELLARLLGLKHFIIGAKEGIADPSEFYDILPYACAMGVEDKWVNRFKNIIVANPDWYKSDTHNMFNASHFIILVNGGTKNIKLDAASAPVNGFMGGQGFRSGNDGNRGGR